MSGNTSTIVTDRKKQNKFTGNIPGNPSSKLQSKMPGNHPIDLKPPLFSKKSATSKMTSKTKTNDSTVNLESKTKTVETLKSKIVKYNEKSKNQDRDSKTKELSKVKTIQEKLMSKMAGGVKKPAREKPVTETVRKPETPLKTSMKKVRKPVSDRKQVKGVKQMQERLKFWLALSDSKPEIKLKPDDHVQTIVDKLVTVDSVDRLPDRKTVTAETSFTRECDRKLETSSDSKPMKFFSDKPPANIDDSMNLTVTNLDTHELMGPGTYHVVDGQVDAVAGGPGGQRVRCDGVCDEEPLQQESYQVFEVLTLPTTPPDTTTLAVFASKEYHTQ